MHPLQLLRSHNLAVDATSLLAFFLRDAGGGTVDSSRVEESERYGLFRLNATFAYYYLAAQGLLLESPYQCVAVADGILSVDVGEPIYSVESDALDWLGPAAERLARGDGLLADMPDPMRLYLRPQVWVLTALDALGLPIEAIAYDGLSRSSVLQSLLPMLRERVALPTVEPFRSLTAAQLDELRFYTFWNANLQPVVQLGTVIGQPATKLDGWFFYFQIRGATGPVDPVFFYKRAESLLSATDRQIVQNLVSSGSISSSAPLLDVNTTIDRASPVQQLATMALDSAPFDTYAYPYWFLLHIKDAIDTGQYTGPLTWDDLARKQKKVYQRRLKDLMTAYQGLLSQHSNYSNDQLIEQLDAYIQTHPTLVPFSFDDVDSTNLFQLEAIVEFFLNFPNPRDLSSAPIGPEDPGYLSPTYKTINLRSPMTMGGGTFAGKTSDLYLVQIDDIRLIGGKLITDWNTGNGIKDPYNGLMFIVKKGRIHSRTQFSSFTSTTNTAAQLRSSIEGNRAYGFQSMAAGAKPSINYSFLVSKPDNLTDYAVPGAQYFDLVNGKAPPSPGGGGIPAGHKSGIMIHYGYKYANGSEGCQVSRGFYDFRASLMDAVLEGGSGTTVDTEWDPDDLRKIKSVRAAEEAKREWDVAIKPLLIIPKLGSGVDWRECEQNALLLEERMTRSDGELVLREEYDGKIYGIYYLVRPGQPLRG